MKRHNVPTVPTRFLAIVNNANDTGQEVHQNGSAQRARVTDNVANAIVEHGREAPGGDDYCVFNCNHHVPGPLVIEEQERVLNAERTKSVNIIRVYFVRQ